MCVRVWIQIVSIYILRFVVGVVIVSGRVYVFGGSCNGESFISVESYLVELCEWRMVNDMF